MFSFQWRCDHDIQWKYTYGYTMIYPFSGPTKICRNLPWTIATSRLLVAQGLTASIPPRERRPSVSSPPSCSARVASEWLLWGWKMVDITDITTEKNGVLNGFKWAASKTSIKGFSIRVHVGNLPRKQNLHARKPCESSAKGVRQGHAAKAAAKADD